MVFMHSGVGSCVAASGFLLVCMFYNCQVVLLLRGMCVHCCKQLVKQLLTPADADAYADAYVASVCGATGS